MHLVYLPTSDRHRHFFTQEPLYHKLVLFLRCTWCTWCNWVCICIGSLLVFVLIFNLSIEWGWRFRFACFVHSIYLHLPSSCQGLLSSYLRSFAKPLSITVCCNVCLEFVQLLWLSSSSSISSSIGVGLPRLCGCHYAPPQHFGVSTPARLPCFLPELGYLLFRYFQIANTFA